MSEQGMVGSPAVPPRRPAQTRGRRCCLTCCAACQPHGIGAGVRTGLGRDPVAHEHVGDKVEAVAWDVPQQHSAGAPVQPRQALCPHDGGDAMHRPLVGWPLPKSQSPGLHTEVCCKDRGQKITSDPGGKRPAILWHWGQLSPLTVSAHVAQTL